ncbi:protein FAR-RED ELONGATED HYPOCOTYL 3-like [Ipomoea triloba]|uniref:protein FAR-RED ELONGATED HYPOCOTYL 3-like n=1 Tax=Ipomoea triloba TaxID=35885 RepID=UPI00125D8242|nr:protein FAR-RED ELONGATED HYPOCOTYL 3-like [Ipomoea triloba]
MRIQGKLEENEERLPINLVVRKIFSKRNGLFVDISCLSCLWSCWRLWAFGGSWSLSSEFTEQTELGSYIMDKEEKAETNDAVNNEERLGSGDEVGGDEGDLYSPEQSDVGEFQDVTLEPPADMEFESNGEALAFYKEYARTMGFETAIQNSRRSKALGEFNDAKFACSRYGTKRGNGKSAKAPGSSQDPENAEGRSKKTDCKACMHVKRRSDGRWIIHRFEKEHNHELSPPQAVSEQTRRVYAAMTRHLTEYKNVVAIKSDEGGQNLAMDAGEVNILPEFFTQMQSMNSNFFYAVEVSEDHRLKNFLWVDAKSRHDYAHFSDVVSFDATYVRNKYKIPIALFIGVNHHYQFVLLGAALLSDETSATLSWVMRTWLRAMGGQAPKAIVTDHEQAMTSVISEIFPSSLHFFCLGKVSESVKNAVKQNEEEFMVKFEECIYRPWTDEEFEERWQSLVDMFELKENELFLSLYEERTKWVPGLMRKNAALLGGMSSAVQSETESVNSFFDKYVQKNTTLQEFIKQYETVLQDRYEEEAKADSDTWNEQPVLKTLSPFEKHMAGVYTHSVFKKFQIEVVGIAACICVSQKQDEKGSISYKIQDCEKDQDFMVTLNEDNLPARPEEVCCTCHLFELKGYLCRHAMVVLQIRGISTIPQQYVMKRWTKDAKNRYPLLAESGENKSRVQRYNDLCQRAMILSEEGSLSQENYTSALHALDEAYGNCVGALTSSTPGLLVEGDNQTRKTNKNKSNPTKKRKVTLEEQYAMIAEGAPDNFAQTDMLTSTPMTLDGYCPQLPQGVQGMLNLMAPNYGNQQTMHEESKVRSSSQLNDNEDPRQA